MTRGWLAPLLLLTACVGSPAPMPERTLFLVRHQPLGGELGFLAPVYDRFVVRVPPQQGLKVWLEVDGEPVAQLGLRHAWEAPHWPLDAEALNQAFFTEAQAGCWLRGYAQEPPADTAWILFRDAALPGLERPHRNVELVLATGWADPADEGPMAGELVGASAQSATWAVPAPQEERARRVLQGGLDGEGPRLVELGGSPAWDMVHLELVPGRPVVLAELPSSRQVRLLVELVPAQG